MASACAAPLVSHPAAGGVALQCTERSGPHRFFQSGTDPARLLGRPTFLLIAAGLTIPCFEHHGMVVAAAPDLPQRARRSRCPRPLARQYAERSRYAVCATLEQTEAARIAASGRRLSDMSAGLRGRRDKDLQPAGGRCASGARHLHGNWRTAIALERREPAGIVLRVALSADWWRPARPLPVPDPAGGVAPRGTRCPVRHFTLGHRFPRGCAGLRGRRSFTHLPASAVAAAGYSGLTSPPITWR